MSLKKVGETKKDRGFKIWDLLVYGIVAVIIAVMFIVVFAAKDTSPLQSVCVYIDNNPVFEYDFVNGESTILKNDGCVEIIADSDEKLTLKFYFGNRGYNTVEIDKVSVSVTVTDADCGSKDCTYMRDIVDNSGIIYCSPHRLKIVPGGYDPDNGIIIM